MNSGQSINQILDQLLNTSRPESSRAAKIQGCILGFYLSASMTKNNKMKNLLLAFSKEIIKLEKVNMDFDKIEKSLPDIIEANVISSIEKMRKSLIIALQTNGMTEDEADLVERFRIDELKQSLIHITEELAMLDATKYIMKIPKIMSPTPELLVIFKQLTRIIPDVGKELTEKKEEEKSKLLNRIIMTDHFRSTLESIIPTVCDSIINGIYSSINLFAKESGNANLSYV